MNNVSRIASVFALSATLQACNDDPYMCGKSEVEFRGSVQTMTVQTGTTMIPVFMNNQITFIYTPQFDNVPRPASDIERLVQERARSCPAPGR